MCFVSLFIFFFINIAICDDDLVCDTSTYDLVFLLDASSSIEDDEFLEEIEFVHGISELLPVSEDLVRISVILFSFPDLENVRIDFTDGSNKERLLELTDINSDECIDRVGMRGRRSDDCVDSCTDLAGALELGREVLYGEFMERTGIEKVMLLVTDGRTYEPDSDVEESDIAKDDGTVIFGVGVSDEVDSEHIASLCTSSENYYALEDFDLLSTIVEDIARAFPCEDEETSYPATLIVFGVLFFVGCCCCWLLLLLALLLLLCCLCCAILSALLGCLGPLIGGMTLVGKGNVPPKGNELQNVPPPVAPPPVAPPPQSGPPVPPVAPVAPIPPVQVSGGAPVTESMYFIGGKQTAVNWGEEGMGWDSMYRPGDMGMGDGFGKEVGLPGYKKMMEERKKEDEEKLLNDDEFDEDDVQPGERFSQRGIKPPEKKKWCIFL